MLQNVTFINIYRASRMKLLRTRIIPGNQLSKLSLPMQDLVNYLKKHVPLTQHIDICAGQHTASWFELNAPLSPNLNDKHTAFGGTLATLCTLSGWCVASYLCREASLNVDIAVTESHIRYHRPVISDPIAARAYFPDQIQADHFIQCLVQNGTARLNLHAELKEGANIAVSFNAEYYVRVVD